MAKSEKKVSIRTIDDAIKASFQNETVGQWHGVDVNVRRCLPLRDMLEFVNDTVATCFDDVGEYHPELFDFAIRNNIVLRYSNFSLPESVGHRYDILCQSDIVEFLCNGMIDVRQLDAIIDAARRKIENVLDLKKAVIVERLDAATSAIEALRKKAEQVFSGVNPGDIEKLSKAITSGALDSDKVVSSYLKVIKGGAQGQDGDGQ